MCETVYPDDAFEMPINAGEININLIFIFYNTSTMLITPISIKHKNRKLISNMPKEYSQPNQVFISKTFATYISILCVEILSFFLVPSIYMHMFGNILKSSVI